MSFIAKNPISVAQVSSTPNLPAEGTRGLFAKEDGWYEIDSYGNVKKIIGTNEVLATEGFVNSAIAEPKQIIYLTNGMRIESREDGIYLCGSDVEYGIEDETLLYSPAGGVQASAAGHANIADEAYTANQATNADYASTSGTADSALTDSEGRTLKGVMSEEYGDVGSQEIYILDGYIVSIGIVSTSLIGVFGSGYQTMGFTSALYFTTPSEIPENYTQFPADIYFKGDSTDEGAFVPEANTRYTILFDFDGYMVNGYVSGVTTV